MKQKFEDLKKKVSATRDFQPWLLYPSTIKMLQKQRGTPLLPPEVGEYFERTRGINATIILLSATCIEGFLLECLKTFIPMHVFADSDTFKGRQDREFEYRVSTATFGDFPELFYLLLGSTLQELLTDKDLVAGVQKLIDFRNGLAHSRPVTYRHEEPFNPESPNFQIGQQYETVHKYLGDKGFLINEDLFQNDIADHFAGLVKPFIDAVVPLLPPDEIKNLKVCISLAYPVKKEM